MIVLGMDGIFRAQFFLSDELPMLVNQRVGMITANDSEESVLRGFELGARDYIIKPYHPRELLSRIHSILEPPVSG